MQLVACQFDIQWENQEANFAEVSRLLETIDIRPGALIALPEMFSTGYSMRIPEVAEKNPSATESLLANTASKYQACVIGGLVYLNENQKGINAAAAFDSKGEKIGAYQKNHCFSYAGEDRSYDSGNETLTFDWQGFRVFPTICYDLRFPELFRRGVKAGANLFIVIANWPTQRIEHWKALLQARSIENLAVVMGVNRIGSDPKLQFSGLSSIFDHKGKLIAQAGDSSQCLTSEVELADIEQWRRAFPALSDMKL